MNGNDWLILLYCFTAINVVPNLCAVRNRCSPIPFPYGTMKLRHAGRMARFTCISGYKLIGDRVAICHNRIWEDVPRCVKDVECPKEIPKVLNGKMILFRDVYFKVVCNNGFKIPEGAASIYPCEKFLNPNEKPPVCQLTDAHFCDFEEGMCDWNNTVPYFSWIRYQNATPSHALNTGPGGDHTTGTGHYLYIEASGLSSHEERFAKIIRHFWKVDTPEVCFVFWYHMYGHSIGTLDVYVDYMKVFSKSGNLGDKWRKGIIQRLPSDREFYISLVATTASGYAGDIAIDDIGLVNSTDCTKPLLIDVTCKNRCFEPETNGTLCKCSSECLIESNCCSDFMQFCSADSRTSSAPSETAEWTSDVSPSSSVSVESSTVSIDYSLASDSGLTSYEGTTWGFEVSQWATAVSEWHSSDKYDTTENPQSTEVPTIFTDSIVKITKDLDSISYNVQRHLDNELLPLATDSDKKETSKPTSINHMDITEVSSQPELLISPVVLPQEVLHKTEADGLTTTTDLSLSTMIHQTFPANASTFKILDTTSDWMGIDSTVEPTALPTTKIHRTSDSSTIVNVASTIMPVMTTLSQPITSKNITSTTTVRIQSTLSTKPSAKPVITTLKTTIPHRKVTFNPVITTLKTTIPHRKLTFKPVITTLKTTIPHRKLTFKPSQKKPEESDTASKMPVDEATAKSFVETNTDTIDLVLGHTHLPSSLSVPSSDDYDLINESTESDSITTDPHYKMIPPLSTPLPTIPNKTSEASYKWKRTYVPKGHYTFSAVRSETRTTTYVSIIVGILVFLAAAAVAGFLFFKRRHGGPSRLRGSTTEESDVLFMTSDEILDFSVARRTPAVPSNRPLAHSQCAPTSSQQMLCPTNEYSL